ncbi:hypothetical protein BJ508DRAFT_334298 [Ascobolus immersus RN42]|uniref:Uncharacterized protein n=1 Tax=Ascobolus immersus RN42 TaxID=1160509 RepID=A0A3N4HGF9_ASCIM|nr:hypothetical protein BJ508DRAFT_334298 [Ascobolus immersus RN42]
MSDASYDLDFDFSSQYDPIPITVRDQVASSSELSNTSSSEMSESFLYYPEPNHSIHFDPNMLSQPNSSDMESDAGGNCVNKQHFVADAEGDRLDATGIGATNSDSSRVESSTPEITGWGLIGISSRLDPIYNRFGQLRTGRDSDDDPEVKQEIEDVDITAYNCDEHCEDDIDNPSTILENEHSGSEQDDSDEGWKRLFSDIESAVDSDDLDNLHESNSDESPGPNMTSTSNRPPSKSPDNELKMLPPPLGVFETGIAGIEHCQNWARDHGYAVSQLSGPEASPLRNAGKKGEENRRGLKEVQNAVAHSS